MNTLRYVIILLILFVCVWCRKPQTGIPCHKGNITGTCRGVLECEYAERTINELEKKVPLCGFDSDGIQIACCPSQNLRHTFGVFRDYFKASNDGVIPATNLTCRYEGRQPLLCCKNQPQILDPPEPEGCPPLPAPILNNTPLEQFLWDKCISYQRYVNKCVHDEYDLEKYIRKDTCGIPKKSNNRYRIFGGEPAEPRQFPHIAAVGCHIENRKDDADIAWVGGGSLISEKIILTAAHVLWSPDYGRIRYALLGTLNKKDNTGLLLNVINTLQHKLYNRKLNNKLYDIALLTLHERVKFNEFVRPICLPVSDRKINSELIIAGWGEINNKAESSEKLLTGNIMENNVSCSNRLKNNFDPKTMICAQGVYERKDSCKGDSGGPLMAIMTNLCCSYSIEGIVSFGQGRCGDNPVGVYTRVTAYLDWIVQNAWPDEWKKFNKKI